MSSNELGIVERTNHGAPPPTEPTSPPDEPTRERRSVRGLFAFSNIGAIYVWIGIAVLFSFWAPETFPTWDTVQSVLNQNAIAGLLALALVIPLAAGVFDLSVGSAMGLCNVIVAWLLVNQGVSIAPAIALTVLAGLLIGIINGFVVVAWNIDSFIATLATGSLMAATISLITNDQAIVDPVLAGDFSKLATTNLGGIAVPVFLMLLVALVIWFVQGYTVVGRRIYASGFNEGGARLSGIRTHRLRLASLVLSSFVAGIGGVLLASQVGSGSPGIGPPYLLDAFAAVFLGATQFGGRFNAWGTVIAVLLLGTGKTGLILVGAPIWAQSMFSGLVLLAALGLTNLERRMDARNWISARAQRRVKAAEAT
jgi:ribose transport system permease protein